MKQEKILLPMINWMKARITSSPHDPYGLGYSCHTKNYTIRCKINMEQIAKIIFGLISAIRDHEIGITSNRKSACFGEMNLNFGLIAHQGIRDIF